MLPFDPRDPRDDPGPYPPPRPHPKPKSEHPPESPTASDKAVTLSETGRAIPILHGTAKVQGTVIEQYSAALYSGFLKAPYWLANHNYSIGDRVTANGNTYVATKDGLSASSGAGPSGTGTNIIDGITSFGLSGKDISVRWDFQSTGDVLFWRPSTVYTVNALSTVVLANGNFYLCSQSGTSAATGTGPSGTTPNTPITDNTCQWLYMPPGWHVQMAVAFCEGEIFGGAAGYSDAGIHRDYTAMTADYIQLFNGSPTGIGARSALFPTPDTVQRDDYANVAVLLVSAGTGADNKIVNIALELADGVGVDATHPDENPADIAIDLLTHARRGAGWSTSLVDTTGTLGSGAASYRTYCTAFGLLLSWVIDTQTTAMALLAQLLLATNSDAVWSGGMLKFFPRGDQALTANGVTYTPVTTPAYTLTQDDIIGQIEVQRSSPQSAFNSYPVEYVDRAGSYVRLTVDDKDLANIDQRGLVRAPTVMLPMVINPGAAIMLSRIYTQRSLRVMNTYRFRLPYKFFLLDPCDIVTIADSVMGMPATPVRITAIEEEQALDGSFLVEAEDYPVAVSAPGFYTPQTGDGFTPVRGTTVARSPVMPSNMQPQTVSDSSSTRGAAVHNVWPNASSEASPPDGADPNRPEWVRRVNAGAGAFAGNWVREMSSVHGSAATRFGDQIAGTDDLTTDATVLNLKVPCSAGQTFRIEAQSKITVQGTGGTPSSAGVGIAFIDSTDNVIGGSPSYNAGSSGAYVLHSQTSTSPAGTCFVLFRLLVNSGTVASGTVTGQFDAINAYQVVETSSDAASAAPALTLAAAGNVFTDIPGTSQSFTPNTASRKIKVSLTFSGFAPIAGASLNVRVVFGGTPTQAGVTYNLWWNTANQHQSWSFMWALAAAALGPVGTAVTVKAQIRSPVAGASFTMDGFDSVSMVVEEIG